ncbi:MAG: ATP phosphoribosyltransferase regulatory subunit, partial [Candidatus Dormibacteraceae bacterium]
SRGYSYLVTPLLESLETVSTGLTTQQQRQLFKLIDRDGAILALVGERTVSVARVAAGKLHSQALPLRLCYSGPVFRWDCGPLSAQREFYQVGAELIGAGGEVADAEVIAAAAGCLSALGLTDYQLEIGHAEFLLGVLAGLEVSAAVRLELRQALARRDLVAVEEVLATTPLRTADQELLLRFPALRGGEEILSVAGALANSDRAERALAELAEVYRLLRIHGLGEVVNIDLGAIRDFDYYTGITFEVYGEQPSRRLAMGGRYDQLMGRLGRPAASTGLVINLDLVYESLRLAGLDSRPSPLDVDLAWDQAGLESALRLAARLRAAGRQVLMEHQPSEAAGGLSWTSDPPALQRLYVTGGDSIQRCDRSGGLISIQEEELWP